jgi:hypothetical protein
MRRSPLSAVGRYAVGLLAIKGLDCTHAQDREGHGQAAANLRAAPSTEKSPADDMFRYAFLYKPSQSDLPQLLKTLAPLIIEQDTIGPRHHEAPELPNPAAELVVYTAIDEQVLAEEKYRRVTYFWCSPFGPRLGQTDCRDPSGIHITIGEDGFPLVWEAWVSSPTTPILFVAEALEKKAADQFGPPAAGRRFSVERDTSRAMIAGVLPDGPVPMGPYVYVTARPANDIVVVDCRCSPSLVQEFTNTRYYTLRPISDLGAGGEKILGSKTPLDRVLRWPAD